MPKARRNHNGDQTIRYPDASGLSRPLDMPPSMRPKAMIIVIVACVISLVMLYFYFDATINAPNRDREAFQENITREVPLDLPDLQTLMSYDDQTIVDTLKADGLNLYERTPVGTSENGGFEVIKLPSDVSIEEAGAAYLSGIDNISPSKAAKLLNGSWTYTVDRSSGTSMRVRYADFTSKSADVSIQNAKASEGLSDVQATDAGIDDAGNTYQAGTIDIDGETYAWRVSVIELSEVYSISSLPESALFVGIRFSK